MPRSSKRLCRWSSATSSWRWRSGSASVGWWSASNGSSSERLTTARRTAGDATSHANLRNNFQLDLFLSPAYVANRLALEFSWTWRISRSASTAKSPCARTAVSRLQIRRRKSMLSTPLGALPFCLQRFFCSLVTGTSACATSARKYVIFTRRLALGSTKACPIMSYRATPMVFRRTMSARCRRRSRGRRSSVWRLSRTRMRRCWRVAAAAMRRRRLQRTVRLAAPCSRVAICSIFDCRLTSSGRDWRSTAARHFPRSLPTRPTADKRVQATRRSPPTVFSRSRPTGRAERPTAIDKGATQSHHSTRYRKRLRLTKPSPWIRVSRMFQ